MTHVNLRDKDISSLDLSFGGGRGNESGGATAAWTAKERATLELVTSLDVSRNSLKDIPKELSIILPRLVDINASRNLLCETNSNNNNNNSSLAAITSSSLNFPRTLTKLDISHNQIASITDLVVLTRLKYLDISFNRIMSFGVCRRIVHPFPELVELRTSNNWIKSLRGLECLTALQNVDARCNSISFQEDIAPLERLPNLRQCLLEGNPLVVNRSQNQQQQKQQQTTDEKSTDTGTDDDNTTTTQQTATSNTDEEDVTTETETETEEERILPLPRQKQQQQQSPQKINTDNNNKRTLKVHQDPNVSSIIIKSQPQQQKTNNHNNNNHRLTMNNYADRKPASSSANTSSIATSGSTSTTTKTPPPNNKSVDSSMIVVNNNSSSSVIDFSSLQILLDFERKSNIQLRQELDQTKQLLRNARSAASTGTTGAKNLKSENDALRKRIAELEEQNAKERSERIALKKRFEERLSKSETEHKRIVSVQEEEIQELRLELDAVYSALKKNNKSSPLQKQQQQQRGDENTYSPLTPYPSPSRQDQQASKFANQLKEWISSEVH